ncbi:MAG: hypothetical protein A2033_10830 [Bacteroidetes bacterium GWA2_31_9]|nr:MAG: hypothetical protein A2033_10830 [Bacteroidetes bacterium GWA2_31_9]
MIISKDINPERDFYYLGAKVIEIISNTEDNKIDFFDVFEKLNTSEKVSINLYTLTLDWLYLLGAINKSKKGNIVKCF